MENEKGPNQSPFKNNFNISPNYKVRKYYQLMDTYSTMVD
jgi:hypothetical protein